MRIDIGRRESVAVGAAVLLLVVAFVVPHLHLGIVTPLLHATPAQIHDYAETAPVSSHIRDYQPNSWITHVSSHPPGALRRFVWLDRIGLPGGAWAGLFCLLIGSSAAVAITARNDETVTSQQVGAYRH